MSDLLPSLLSTYRPPVAVGLCTAIFCAVVGCSSDGGEEEASTAERYDVVVITLDTMRPDRLGCYGNKTVKTPHIDALATESTIFEKAFTPVPSTLPSHCSIMTGMYPAQHGVHDNGVYFLPARHDTLAEILEDQGYETAAFVSAFVLDAQFRLNQGFAVYDDKMESALSSVAVEDLPEEKDEGRKRWNAMMSTEYQRRAETVTKRTIEWFDMLNEDDPFFLWVHYFDPHAPYTAPDEFERMYDADYEGEMDGHTSTFFEEMARKQEDGSFSRAAMDRDVQHMIARYEGEVTYMDKWLGELVSALKAKGRWEDTVVIVVGDHGESFGEHQQIWEHNGEIYDEVVHVPLLVRLPGGTPKVERTDSLVRTIDVAPTLLDLLEMKIPSAMEGDSLLSMTEDQHAKGKGEVFLQALREKQVLGDPAADGRTESWLGVRDSKKKAILGFGKDGRPGRTGVFDLTKDASEQRPTADQGDKWKHRILGEERRLKSPGPLPLRRLSEIETDALVKLGYLKKEKDD